MADLVLAFDLGTGGCKSSLWTPDGACVGSGVATYQTFYPALDRHEQRPTDWWRAVCAAAQQALAGLDPRDVVAIAVSGHSLGAVALDASGELVYESTPIWSDSRAVDEARGFFETWPESRWYTTTGSGFPPELYPLFKIAWYRDSDPRGYERTRAFLGSKDWINFQLTGEMATDPSYASGSGAMPLAEEDYSPEILSHAGIDRGLLPRIVPSTSLVGLLLSGPASELGLTAGIEVYAGGVDNSCMSTGSLNTEAGRVYISLGSSSWVTASVATPVVDYPARPYTFRSLRPGLFDSALSSFSSGTSIDWVRQMIGGDTDDAQFVALAGSAPVGASGITFLPTLAGGSPMEGGARARGAFLGLDVGHDSADLARAAFEGSAFAIARAFALLTTLSPMPDSIVVTGGPSQSAWIRQLYADVLGCNVVGTTIQRQAAALGAAAAAFVGSGRWNSLDEVARAHEVTAVHHPDPGTHARYLELRAGFSDFFTTPSSKKEHTTS